MTMDISSVISYTLIGILAAIILYVAISMIVGLVRGLKKTVSSHAVIVFSALISYGITKLILNPEWYDITTIINKVAALIGKAEIDTLLGLEGMTMAIACYACMIIAPFIFFVIFLIIRFNLGIAMRIVNRYIPAMDSVPAVGKRLGGLGVGLVNAVIVCLIFCLPLLGTLDIANNAIVALESAQTEQATEGGADELPTEPEMISMETPNAPEKKGISDYLGMITDNKLSKVVLDFGGRAIYDSLASSKYNGERVTLRGEATAIISIATPLMTESEDNQVVVIVDAVAIGVKESPIIRDVSAQLVSGMAQAWQKGESFLGISQIAVGEDIAPMMNALVGVLANETDKTIVRDIGDIANLLHEVDDAGLLDSGNTDTITLFAEQGTLASILGTIDENENMVVLIDEFNCLCIKLIADSFGFVDTDSENYDKLILDLANEVTRYRNGEVAWELAADEILTIVHNHGIKLSKSEAENLTEGLLSDSSLPSYASVEADVRDFFLIYAGVKNSTLVEDADGKLSVDGNVIQGYSMRTYMNTSAYRLAMQERSIGDAMYLYSAEGMKKVSILKTTESILNSLHRYNEIEDRHAETVKIDAVMTALAQSYTGIEGDSLHVSDVMSEMGVVLDKMSESTVYGEATRVFLTAVMQSKKVANSIGLDVVEMTEFADKVFEGRTENASYSNISATVSQSLTVLEGVKKGEANKEDVQALMKDLSPDTAKVMQSLVSPSLMKNYGVKSDDKAEKTSNAVCSLFENMANYTTQHPKEEQESDEEYYAKIDKEAEATNKIITLAIKANEDIDDTEVLFNSQPSTDAAAKDGALGMTAYDVVDLFVTSQVASDTANDLAKGENGEDPLGVKKGLLSEDKAELEGALDSYYEENKGQEGLEDKLQNIGNIFGIIYTPAN